MRTTFIKWQCDRCGDTTIVNAERFPEGWEFPGKAQICPRCAQNPNPWDVVRVGDWAPGPIRSVTCSHVIRPPVGQACLCVRDKRHLGQHVSVNPAETEVIAVEANTEPVLGIMEGGDTLLMEVTRIGAFDDDVKIRFVDSEHTPWEFLVRGDRTRPYVKEIR